MDNLTFLNQFDSIPVKYLPRIAEMNRRLADIIEHHYIRNELRLHEKPIFFSIGYSVRYFRYNNATQHIADIGNKMIDIWESDELLAFKQFCHIFTDITKY